MQLLGIEIAYGLPDKSDGLSKMVSLPDAGSFQLPRKLYGREKEVAALTAAFERACSGQSGLMLAHGYAGTGKTVLI